MGGNVTLTLIPGGDYALKYENILNEYWDRIRGSLIGWKNCYEWPVV